MAVTSVKERFGRQYTSKITGDKNAVKVFCVLTDSDYTQLSDLVRDAVTAGLPDLGDAFGADSGETELIAVEHNPVEIERELRYFNVEVRYETNRIAFDSPTDQQWQIQFTTLFEEVVPEQTLYNTGTVLPVGQVKAVGINKPILNSAGFPFDPPVTDNNTKIRISLTKNFSKVTDIGSITDIDDLLTRVNTVNDDQIQIVGVDADYFQFWIENIEISNVTANGENFYAVTFHIIYDNEYHYKKILNAGWIDKNGNEILGDKGGPISNPWPLDVNGDPIRGGVANRQNNAIYYGFGVKRLSTFSELGLPADFGASTDLPIT